MNSYFKATVFTLLVLTITLNNDLCFSQNSDDNISIGKFESVYSEILEEERSLMVHLPQGYDHTSTRYPVLYILDGDFIPTFAKATGTVDVLSYNGQIPPMIIVSIRNTDRGRDMFPIKIDRISNSGGADKFLGFINEELIPFVNRNYRTVDNKVLFGESNSALFTIYALLTKPDTFDAYVASSPTIGWCSDLISDKARTTFEERKSLNKFLYIIYGENDFPQVITTVPGFTKILKDNSPKDFRWETVKLDNEGHVPYISLKNGIEAYYSEIVPTPDMMMQGLEGVISFYKDVSKKFDFEICPPEMVLFNLAGPFLAQKQFSEAKEILEYLVIAHPASADGYFFLGEVYRDQKENSKALRCYRKAIEIDPNYLKAKTLLTQMMKNK
ncbi:alpha/beta hydrolase-fold protein [candidate division KSB1 bacterium]